ncbi:MAG TPA: protein kinase, partial [Polyangiaceae bacterium]
MTEALAATVVDESAPAGSVSGRFHTEELPDVGDVVGGHYRLVRLLGKGMFGKVYVAERIDVPAHQVALKVVPREVYSGRNVERELVMLAAASHPNIVQLKDHGMTEAYVWLTMPVYEGETLADRLKRGPLNLDEAYEVFLPIARALDALHNAGLRHQDIKPENIFLATFAGR